MKKFRLTRTDKFRIADAIKSTFGEVKNQVRTARFMRNIQGKLSEKKITLGKVAVPLAFVATLVTSQAAYADEVKQGDIQNPNEGVTPIEQPATIDGVKDVQNYGDDTVVTVSSDIPVTPAVEEVPVAEIPVTEGVEQPVIDPGVGVPATPSTGAEDDNTISGPTNGNETPTDEKNVGDEQNQTPGSDQETPTDEADKNNTNTPSGNEGTTGDNQSPDSEQGTSSNEENKDTEKTPSENEGTANGTEDKKDENGTQANPEDKKDKAEETSETDKKDGNEYDLEGNKVVSETPPEKTEATGNPAVNDSEGTVYVGAGDYFSVTSEDGKKVAVSDFGDGKSADEWDEFFAKGIASGMFRPDLDVVNDVYYIDGFTEGNSIDLIHLGMGIFTNLGFDEKGGILIGYAQNKGTIRVDESTPPTFHPMPDDSDEDYKPVQPGEDPTPDPDPEPTPDPDPTPDPEPEPTPDPIPEPEPTPEPQQVAKKMTTTYETGADLTDSELSQLGASLLGFGAGAALLAAAGLTGVATKKGAKTLTKKRARI